MYFFVHFFFFKAGEMVVGTRQQLMLVSEKNFLFLVEYNGNTRFRKREKNGKKF